MEQTGREVSDSLDMKHIADSAVDEIRPGKILKGEIVTIDGEYAYVSVGTKSDGRIPIEEFDRTPLVGEIIDVLMHHDRLVDGMYQFSKREAEIEKSWSDFFGSYKNGNVRISGKIAGISRKGKHIDCRGISGFLPFSQSADLKAREKSDEEYTFKIQGIDENKRTLLLSRKEYLDEENRVKWDHFTAKYKTGDRVAGTVIKFVEFGAFVRVEGIDALLHRNDMSWKKVFKQRKLFKVNEEREFVILDINREEGKLSLGLKQLLEDPWLSLEGRYSPGMDITGKVVTLTTYGAFVEIEEGVEGFVASHDLTWAKGAIAVDEILKRGDSYNFRILEINREDRKILLGYRQLFSNPWDTIDERFPAGSVHRKRIKKIIKFGMFVELENGVDGMIHLTDINWDDNVKSIPDSYRAGDEVEFKILRIEKDEMKISCGIKQLMKSPWEAIREKYPPRSMVSGVVSGITQFGLFVRLEEDIEGLVHISEVSRKRLENLAEHFQVGENVNVVVLGVDVDKKRLSLSIKHYDIIAEKEELDRVMKNTSPSTVTLGDIIGLKIGERK